MFTVAERDRARERVLEMAGGDPRVVAGAALGSLALGDGDRWSDVDLMFAVSDGTPVTEVLDDWTASLTAEFDAALLFDLPVGAALYRVFVLPGCLQFDLSFAPASQFGAAGPNFRLLFGQAADRPQGTAPSAGHLFGMGVHHALRARFCIERERFWQAEYWISGARDQALTLACRNRNLSTFHGRGFDQLPADLLDQADDALVRSLVTHELRRALSSAIELLRRESTEVPELAAKIEPRLRELANPAT